MRVIGISISQAETLQSRKTKTMNAQTFSYLEGHQDSHHVLLASTQKQERLFPFRSSPVVKGLASRSKSHVSVPDQVFLQIQHTHFYNKHLARDHLPQTSFRQTGHG